MSVGVITYVNEHITENITLASIAGALGYSPKYLSNCINKLFGMNLRTLIAAVRVNKAKYLLRETEKNNQQIMQECGFPTERSFDRQFKAILGRTPKYIRQNYYKGAAIDQGIVKKF
jgi:AraC-like DNA-binding protein